MSRNRRQAIYDRIRASSKTEHIREEMIRLGFWSESQEEDAALRELIEERQTLSRKVRALKTEWARLQDLEAMKREAHKRRLAEARARRASTQARREQERQARAAAWRAQRASQILWLGEGVSGALGQQTGDADKLRGHGLPPLDHAEAIARAMGINLGELRWLAFGRRVSQTTHYQRFTVPKKTRGERLISAPMPRLKAVQTWIHEQLLLQIPVHDAAHGFVRGRSILTNGRPHVGQAVVINLDLKDFFPTVEIPRVRGLFRALGYSPEASAIFALLCTEPEITTVELDGQSWHVATSARRLPQGSPASPALTNILCRRLDRRLAGLARAMGFVYTRYADDLTLSSPHGDAPVQKLLRAVGGIVEAEGFVVHPDKTRVMRRGRRQEVTGLVVNDQLGVARPWLRQFRATLFQVERDGPEGKRWGRSGSLFASLFGFAGFVAMVDPEKGRPLVNQVKALAIRHGYAAPELPVTPPPSWSVPDQDAHLVASSTPAEPSQPSASPVEPPPAEPSSVSAPAPAPPSDEAPLAESDGAPPSEGVDWRTVAVVIGLILVLIKLLLPLFR